jgi:hypothetical protein
MKKFLVFTVLFLSSFLKVSACGYSPYGEDVRYCLFNPNYFNYNQYYGFYYNNFIWGYDLMKDDFQDKISYEANILDWYNYTNKKVAINEIIFFNNNLKMTDIQSDSNNEFLNFLYKNKKNDVIKYLIYAKKCEVFNGYFEENVWERNVPTQKQSASNFEKELVQVYNSENNLYLKRKYAFQCIRLAFYNGNLELIKTIFNKEFLNTKKDYLYYWSLYFNCFTNNNNGNYNDIAELFTNCPEKTFASQFYFNNKFNLEKALPFAKNPTQVANLYAYASARVLDKNLDNLKLIYQNKPKFKTLDFLLLREINKIEDWVYTPFYTNYSPSIEEEGYYDESESSKITTQTLRMRAAKDRIYAQEVLNFINLCDISKVDNPVLWRSAKIQLLFITQQYDEALISIKDFEAKHKKEKVVAEIEKIKALCITAKQQYDKAIITNEVNTIIEKNLEDKRFLFALGRELEFKGNLLEGIALISMSDHNNYSEDEYNSNDVEWRGNRLQTTANLDVFSNYFDYLDFVYSANDLQILINKLNQISSDKKNDIIYQSLLKDKNYLTDMLGTKYIREEKINLALITFKSLGNQYWQDNYNAWERGKFNEFMMFDENPFYTIKYTNDFIEKKDHYFVNKLTITEHLIKYLRLANDVKRKDRDYYYFLIANCYLNMTDMGNSWMMRRFESNSSYYSDEFLNESYIDNLEYRSRNKTIEYYDLAYQNSKSDKFRALCLHMINFAQGYVGEYNKLKAEYPEYNDELSNCYALESFFNSRR